MHSKVSNQGLKNTKVPFLECDQNTNYQMLHWQQWRVNGNDTHIHTNAVYPQTSHPATRCSVCLLSFLILSNFLPTLSLSDLAKGTALVRSTSSLHHFLFLLVVIVLGEREGRRDEGGGRGGHEALFPSSASPAWPPPYRLDPCRPGRASQTTRWLSVSCLSDWQDIHSMLETQSNIASDCYIEPV